jgi:hypothetical protein
MVSVQVADFSPVIAEIHVFHPISQLQGFGFPPVTGFHGTFFLLRQAEPAPIEMRNSECGEFGRAVRKTGGREGFGCSRRGLGVGLLSGS